MRVVVIGAGPAGISASIRARRLRAEVLLLERNQVGGVCYNEGPVPVRTLARVARMVRDAGGWSEFGLSGDRPTVDLRVALDRARWAVRYIHDVKCVAEGLRAEDIEVAEGIGPARFIDTHTVAIAGGRTISADRIIVAAENAVLGLDCAYEAAVVPSGSFTDPEYASVGLTESQARATQDCVVARHVYSALTRAVVDNRMDGFCKLIADRRSGTLLGAHVLGEYSAELIQVAAMCMAARMTVLQIAQVQLAYPTFAQAIGLAALKLAREMDLLPRAESLNY